MMTRKHYCAIAEAIAETRRYVIDFYDENKSIPPATRALDLTAQRLASEFKSDNPRFDRSRFLRACGASE